MGVTVTLFFTWCSVLKKWDGGKRKRVSPVCCPACVFLRTKQMLVWVCIIAACCLILLYFARLLLYIRFQQRRLLLVCWHTMEETHTWLVCLWFLNLSLSLSLDGSLSKASMHEGADEVVKVATAMKTKRSIHYILKHPPPLCFFFCRITTTIMK